MYICTYVYRLYKIVYIYINSIRIGLVYILCIFYVTSTRDGEGSKTSVRPWLAIDMKGDELVRPTRELTIQADWDLKLIYWDLKLIYDI